MIPVYVLAALALSVPVAAGFTVNHLAAVPVPSSYSAIAFSYPVTLSVGVKIGEHLGTPFWAANIDDELAIKSLVAVGNYLNSTPITTVRLGGGGNDYNPTLQVQYVAPSSGVGTYVAQPGQLTNFTWFKAWCYSKSPHCQWETYLPAEENNSQAAVHVAQYFHTVLKFVPTYWEFGNEPTAWTHYGINQTRWSTYDNVTPTGLDYAVMVRSYIAAISALYPSDQYIGIQANCACGTSMISDTALLNGPKLAALAYHEYPWATNSSVTVSQFFGALNSSRAMNYTMTHMRYLVTQFCPTCQNIPIQVGEYNAGPVPDHSPFADEYPGAVFIAASVIQALEENVSMFTFFNLGYLINSTNGVIQPEGMLYQRILANMTMGSDYPVTVNSPSVGGVYALEIKNGTRIALLIANTNSTKGVSFGIPTSIFAATTLGSYWTWGPWGLVPIAHRSVTVPGSIVMPHESVILLTNY